MTDGLYFCQYHCKKKMQTSFFDGALSLNQFELYNLSFNYLTVDVSTGTLSDNLILVGFTEVTILS